MVNPIDVQGFIVRAVDSTQSVNQAINAANAAQHTGMMENVQRMEHERHTVNPRSNVEQSRVGTSTEGGSRGAYTPFFGRRGRRELDRRLKDDKRGMILDVRL